MKLLLLRALMRAKLTCATLLLPAFGLSFLIACGGAANTGNERQVSVAISPMTATLDAGRQQQFQATVTGSSDTSVTWQVNNVTGGNAQSGTISNTGLYVAPNPGDRTLQVTVTAVANANPAKTASATVTVNPSTGGGGGGGGGGGTTITVSPTRAALTTSESQQFTAAVSGGGAPASFTWEVDGIAGGDSSIGSITNSGLYTPPAMAGAHTITASIGNVAASASASVWVTDYPGMMTYHADNYRSGVNHQELALTSDTVNPSSFGKLFSFPVEGQIYAQPLYVANLNFNGTYHNVVFVATEHDAVYAFDADGKSTTPLWQRSFIDPGHGITTFPQPANGLISPEVGITGTPAIDPASKTIYVLALTVEHGTSVHRLHALDLLTGAEKFNGPVQITGSYGGSNFDSARELQRPALLLLNGVVYIAFGSYGDNPPWQGWVFGYSASGGSLHQVSAIGTAPQQGKAAIWMSGGGPAADDSGNIYVVTGNGDFNLNTGGGDAGNTFLKLNSSLQIRDYYTPINWSELNSNDLDLGNGGVMLPPTQTGGNAPNLVICGGKDGQIYIVNRDNMGHYSPSNDPAVQKLSLGQPDVNGNWFTPAAWKNWIYFGATGDNLRQYQFNQNLLPASQSSASPQTFGYPGPTPMISTDGTDGIVWALDNSAYFGGTPGGGVNTPGPAVLHAYRADNLGTELYNSSQSGSRDTGGTAIKFTAPTIANGHVYVGGAGTLTVYGVLP